MGYVNAPDLGRNRREHPHCFWQHLDFDGRHSQDFAVPVEEALAISGEAHARGADTSYIRIRKIAASEKPGDDGEHLRCA